MKKDTENIAVDEDGVWTAFIDEDIDADDECDISFSLEDSRYEFWFSDDEDNSQDPQGIILDKQDILFN